MDLTFSTIQQLNLLLLCLPPDEPTLDLPFVQVPLVSFCFACLYEFPRHSAPQGFDAACQGIFLCVGGNIRAAAQVFCKWAVPVSWLMFNDYDGGKHAINPVSHQLIGVGDTISIGIVTAVRRVCSSVCWAVLMISAWDQDRSLTPALVLKHQYRQR